MNAACLYANPGVLILTPGYCVDQKRVETVAGLLPKTGRNWQYKPNIGIMAIRSRPLAAVHLIMVVSR